MRLLKSSLLRVRLIAGAPLRRRIAAARFASAATSSSAPPPPGAAQKGVDAAPKPHVLDRTGPDGKTPHISETHRVAARRPEQEDGGWGWFIVGCTLVGSIVGWMVKGSYEGKRRKVVSEAFAAELAVSPVEIFEVRSMNNFTGDELLAVVDASTSRFPRGRATTKEFTAFVIETLGEERFARGVKRGYYLERLLYKLDIAEMRRVAEAAAGGGFGDGVEGRSEMPPHDVRLLLVAFSVMFNSGPWERLDNLLRAWPRTECVGVRRAAARGGADAGSSVDAGHVEEGDEALVELEYAADGGGGAMENTLQLSEREEGEEEEEEETCVPCDAVKELITHLMTTNQFPAEKVVATGERGNIVEGEPPLLLYHRASAAELMEKGFDQAEKEMKAQEYRRKWWWWWPFANPKDAEDIIAPPRDAALRFDELVELLSTEAVCAWGECYSDR